MNFTIEIVIDVCNFVLICFAFVTLKCCIGKDYDKVKNSQVNQSMLSIKLELASGKPPEKHHCCGYESRTISFCAFILQSIVVYTRKIKALIIKGENSNIFKHRI